MRHLAGGGGKLRLRMEWTNGRLCGHENGDAGAESADDVRRIPWLDDRRREAELERRERLRHERRGGDRPGKCHRGPKAVTTGGIEPYSGDRPPEAVAQPGDQPPGQLRDLRAN